MPLPGNQQKQEGGNLPDPVQIHPCPTPPFLITLILHFHYNASASGTAASSGTPSASTSRQLLVYETPSTSWTGKGRHPLFILIPCKAHTAFYRACQCNQKWCCTTNKNNYQALMIIQDSFYVFSLSICTVSLIRLNLIFPACHEHVKNSLIHKNIQSLALKGCSHV